MKLALIRQRYNPFGGAERFVERAMTALAAQDLELTLLTRSWSEKLLGTGSQDSADADAAVRVIRCNPFYIGRVWRDWGFARSVRGAVKSGNFDLVQSHERIACCDIYRAGDGVHRQWLINRKRAAGSWERIALTLNPYHWYTLAAERRLFQSPRLRAVICNSNMVKQELRHHFGLPESKLKVIYSGVDLAAYHPGLRQIWRERKRKELGIADASMVFLFVGSGFRRKGLPQLLRAISGVEEAHLVVVGADKELPSLRQGVGNSGLSSRVHFTGGQDDVKPWYGMADCFVLPTIYDPFPNAALEAMACGLPLVTSLQCGAAEFVESGVEGYVCRDPLDVVELVRCLKLAAAPGQAQRMGAAARRKVEAHGLEGMARQLTRLYSDLLRELSQ
ncbi:MAG: glycosyltransferase family 4 protein [Burkholderiales bacterium]|nr:glycosyltransferase family 4 protein [Burkholderiales bacterium]